jgi:DNA adenine methylase
MAPEIVDLLGDHKQYFEPFCGSMAVLLVKPASPQETVNDLHGDITNLAWVLQDPDLAAALYDRAGRTLFAEAMIRELWRELGNSPCPEVIDAERAYKFFVFSWAMRNGVAGTSRVRGNGFQIALRFTPRGGSPTIRFRSAIESIPAWHDRLRNVVILRRNALDLIPRFDDSPGLAIYADPPYAAESRAGYAAGGATSRYEHEFDQTASGRGLFENSRRLPTHDELADRLKKFTQARVVVSYYDCPRVRRLYKGWTFRDSKRQKNLHCQNRRGESAEREAPELLITNF